MEDRPNFHNFPPPREAYNFWPHPSYIFFGKGKKAQRFIFGKQKFSDFETLKLNRLLSEVQKGKIRDSHLLTNWTKEQYLRFCYGTGWKTRNAVKAIQNYIDSVKKISPDSYTLLLPNVRNLIDQGCVYVHGRDNMYRPALIVDFTKFDFSNYNLEQILEMSCYILDFVIDEMMIPGQIENWVVLTEMGNKGLSTMSLGNLKGVIGFMENNYRSRLGMCFVLNPPKSISFIWTCVKPFLDAITIAKVKIVKGDPSKELFKFFNPGEIEERFGGEAPSLNGKRWPPVVPDTSFFTETGKADGIIGEDTYEEFRNKVFFEDGELEVRLETPGKSGNMEEEIEREEEKMENRQIEKEKVLKVSSHKKKKRIKEKKLKENEVVEFDVETIQVEETNFEPEKKNKSKKRKHKKQKEIKVTEPEQETFEDPEYEEITNENEEIGNFNEEIENYNEEINSDHILYEEEQAIMEKRERKERRKRRKRRREKRERKERKERKLIEAQERSGEPYETLEIEVGNNQNSQEENLVLESDLRKSEHKSRKKNNGFIDKETSFQKQDFEYFFSQLIQAESQQDYSKRTKHYPNKINFEILDQSNSESRIIPPNCSMCKSISNCQLF